MTDLAGAPAAPGGQSLAQPIPAILQPQATPAAVPATATAAEVQLTSAQLKSRLDETRTAAESALLKRLGFESGEAADAFLKSAKAMQQAQMSEQEKLAARVKELEPLALEAATYKTHFAAMVETQFAALPDAAKTAIDASAKGDPARRAELMTVMRAAGLLNGSPATPTPAPAPANAGAGQGAPPKPTNAQTPFDQWSALVAAGKQTHADIFYQANAPAINASRPAS